MNPPTQRDSTWETWIPYQETPLNGSWVPQAETMEVLVEVGVPELWTDLGNVGQTSPEGVPAFPGWIGRAQVVVESWVEEPQWVGSPCLGQETSSAGKGTG